MSRTTATLLKLGVTVVILAFLARQLDLPTLWRQLRPVAPGWYLAALASIGATIWLGNWRWQVLLRVQSIFPGFRPLLAVSFIGLFFNTFLLGSAGGDLIRATYLARLAPENKTGGLASIAMDRILGLLVMLLLALVALVLAPAPLQGLDRTQLLTATAVTVLGLTTLIFLVPIIPTHRLPARLRAWWNRAPGARFVAQLAGSWQSHLRHPLALATAFVLTACSHALTFLGGYFLARALGLNVPYTTMAVTLALVISLLTLPVSLGGHGLREALFVLLFTGYGVVGHANGLPGPEAAVAFSLLLFSTQLFWNLIGGAVYLGFSRSSPPSSAVSPG